MKALYSAMGFILFTSGMLAIILSLVGVKLAPLLWIDSWGGLVGFIIRIAMVLAGILIVYLARSNWRDFDDK